MHTVNILIELINVTVMILETFVHLLVSLLF
jgi:hypothetical protein